MNFVPVIITAIIAFAVVAAVKMIVEYRLKAQVVERKKSTESIVLPLRLQAYERMALFLERIEPNQLVMRIHAPGLTVAQEQNLLLTAIRSEFEHNLSQQIYISSSVWTEICNAKDDIMEIINTVAEQMDADTTGQTFAESLLIAASQKPVVEKALNILKADMHKML